MGLEASKRNSLHTYTKPFITFVCIFDMENGQNKGEYNLSVYGIEKLLSVSRKPGNLFEIALIDKGPDAKPDLSIIDSDKLPLSPYCQGRIKVYVSPTADISVFFDEKSRPAEEFYKQNHAVDASALKRELKEIEPVQQPDLRDKINS